MKYLFLLSQDYPEIAAEEASSLFGSINLNISNKLLILGLNQKIKPKLNRLALTKNIYKHLFECKTQYLKDAVKKFDWAEVYKKNFCLRVHYLESNKKYKFSEKELAGIIWRSLEPKTSPKVNLKNPATKIEIFIFGDVAHCGLLFYENREDFESRKAHLRPYSHPSSLHPKLARALVNISEIEGKKTLLDPFCGTGGFLIEAGMMDIKTIGYDIIYKITEGCIDNLEYYKIRNYKIVNRNALSVKGKFDFVVTDLPYGLNSNVFLSNKSKKLNKKLQLKDFTKDLEKFYSDFLLNLRKSLRKKAVIIFPNFVDYKKLLAKSKFKIEKEFSVYVHGSLTRKIVKVS